MDSKHISMGTSIDEQRDETKMLILPMRDELMSGPVEKRANDSATTREKVPHFWAAARS